MHVYLLRRTCGCRRSVQVLGCLGFYGHPDFVSAVTNAETTGNDFVLTADGHWAGSHPHEVLSRLGAHSAIRSSTKRADTVKVCEVGKKVPRIKKSVLRDELVILPDVAMSATDVVRALRKYIKKVEENGMLIGRYKIQR